MKRTPDQLWYKDSRRRPQLIDRRSVLSLHSITDLSEIRKTDQQTYYTTVDKRFEIPVGASGLGLPKTKWTRGQTFWLETAKHCSPELLEIIQSNYCIIKDPRGSFAVDYDPVHTPDKLCLIYLAPKDQPPYSFKDWVIIDPGDIENVAAGTKPFVTTYGRYFVNYYLIASVFMEAADAVLYKELEFINQVWNISKFESNLSQLLVEEKIFPSQCDTYIDNGYFMTGFGELCGATFTKKAIVPSPDLIKRREELLEKYADRLDDPRTMIIIDNELIAMDKDYLKGDPSMDFLGNQKKAFTVERKKQYSAVGMVETFGAQKGNYVYIPSSLTEGVDIKHFALTMDESRRGFFGRAVETQIAGVDTKLMIAVFQNAKITADDCGTNRCLELIIQKEIASSFMGQYVQTGPGKYEQLTRDNIDNYIGRPVRIRSFMYCAQPDGYCMKCAGNKFKFLDYRNPGVATIDVGAVFMSMSMKAMHGTKIDSLDLESLNDYVVNP